MICVFVNLRDKIRDSTNVGAIAELKWRGDKKKRKDHVWIELMTSHTRK